MSKEYLEAFKKIAEIYGNTGSLEGTYKYFLTIKRALARLDAIDNANPSEALECLERIDNTLCLNNNKGKLEFGVDTEEHTDCDSAISMVEDLETIKQALIKAQKPKQYLTWKDLIFSKEPTYIKATLNSIRVTIKCWKEYMKEWCSVDFNNAPCNNIMFVHHGYDDDTDTQSNLFDALGFVRI